MRVCSFFLCGSAALALGAAVMGTAAVAQQRDPAYAAARAAGMIGEKMDGYLGFVGSPSANVKRVIDDLNIKRKAVYAQQAQTQHATVEEYAFTSGCVAIARTVTGEKYQAPDGSWQTRTSAPPQRDARCP